MPDLPKNLILYGPPGTGKTFHSLNRALQILVPEFLHAHATDRTALKHRFDELRTEGRIGFVTFHQSFSYEDFVEGLKANSDEDGRIRYEVEDGIFKRLCETASANSAADNTFSETGIERRRIWKMSLGNTLGEDAYIYDECIERGYILLGYGDTLDFSDCPNREAIRERYAEISPEIKSSDYPVRALHTFIHTIRKGDIVIVSDGNQKFRAIAEVTGGYRYFHAGKESGIYCQCRDVNWLRVYSPSLPAEVIFNKNISQMALYELKAGSLKLEALARLLTPETPTDEPAEKPYVLIIDEINRGNISRIFGELITLLETDKRSSETEAMSVRLPYSKTEFSIPSNLYLIGTMNTADRSLALMDTALRRRFVFEEMLPAPDLLSNIDVAGIDIARMLQVMNDRIELLYDREHTLGHSFFLPLQENPELDRLAAIFATEILPLLEEYFFDDWEKIRRVLNDQHRQSDKFAFYRRRFTDQEIEDLLGENDLPAAGFIRNQAALYQPAAYIGIYDS